jgi:hypothetical protein
MAREYQYLEKNMPYPVHVLGAGVGFRPEQLSGAGALSTDLKVSELSITGGTAVAFTLADGVEGQEHIVYLLAKGGAGNAVLTPAHFSDGTTITFAAADTFAKLLFLGGKWKVMSKSAANVTVA